MVSAFRGEICFKLFPVLCFAGSGPVYVCHVVDNSPASKAGVCVGDMLLQVNGYRVKHARKQDVESILAKSCQIYLKMVLIAGSLSMLHAEALSQSDSHLRKTVVDFCKQVWATYKCYQK